MTDSNQSAYLEEEPRLRMTADEIRLQREQLDQVPRYRGDDYTEQVLESVREENRQQLARIADEPYFGRLDYQERGAPTSAPLYIGKRGLEHSGGGRLLVIDWRAPVAELYYSFTGGEDSASYESPDGTVEGDVHLKRNLLVRQGELQRVVDSYVRGQENLGGAVADEFLLYRLGENKDNKLRDIVSTIQAEQDRIIRADRNKALVIQGVAGSGKTTVALHRLAYLLYRYRDSMRAERMIIFAPNRMFLDYISGVLPELGVGHIKQTTLPEWALDRLHDSLKLADATASYEEHFRLKDAKPPAGARKAKAGADASADTAALAETDQTEPPAGRFKGSLAFSELINAELDRFEADFIPELAYSPWDGRVLKAEQIRKWFYEDIRHYPLMKRRERGEARIRRWLEMQLDQIGDPKVRKDRKQKANAKLKTYLKQWPAYTPLTFYAKLFEPGAHAAVPPGIAQATLKLLRKKTVSEEDLAPLLHIHNRWYGVDGNDRFDHAVIDEAQDFSPYQLAVLRQHVPTGSFTILGDLSQGIHDYRGIHHWEEFLDQFPEDSQGFFRLDRSYRSTTEIIEFANSVLTNGGLGDSLAVPVFRTGEPVQIRRIPSTKERQAVLAETVSAILAEGGMNTVAVITRTAEEATEAHDSLLRQGMTTNLIHAGNLRYEGGLSVVPVYLAKGLEFDAVILTDVDERHYLSDTRDAKLLYVASTRALHRLDVLYSGEPSKLLPILAAE
ncbi:HelD family protein [Gorillibacterium timonense]|uniref:HelD family protein n=1 Tax=Gorillibacterium timonense TaxID=1689269 RepID=UPI000A6A5F55|nr:3'-5' exonuclease [Gorillibacterium timonense]